MSEELKTDEKCRILERSAVEGKDRGKVVDKLKGIGSVLAWDLAVVVSSTCCQMLKRRIPDFQLNSMRVSVSVAMFLCLLLYNRKWPVVRRNNIPVVMVAGLFGCTTSLTLYIAVTFIPVSNSQCVMMASTVFCGLVMFAIFSGEKVTVRKVLLVTVCMFGVVLVIQPDFIFKKGSESIFESANSQSNLNLISGNFTHVNGTDVIETNSQSEYNLTYGNVIHMHGNDVIVSNNQSNASIKVQNHKESPYIIFAYLLPVTSGLALATGLVLTKKYPILKEEFLETGTWCNLVGLFMSVVPMLIFEHITLPSNWEETFLILGHCLSYLVIWPAFIWSATYATGHVASIIYGLTAVFMLVPQYTILSTIHPGNKNMAEVAGVILVLIGSIAGSVIELFCESRKKN